MSEKKQQEGPKELPQEWREQLSRPLAQIDNVPDAARSLLEKRGCLTALQAFELLEELAAESSTKPEDSEPFLPKSDAGRALQAVTSNWPPELLDYVASENFVRWTDKHPLGALRREEFGGEEGEEGGSV